MSSDAAALPSPPDMPPWKDGQRPYSVGHSTHTSAQVSGLGSYSNGTVRPTPSRRPRFPNIKDLQDQAVVLNVNETSPVCLLPKIINVHDAN